MNSLKPVGHHPLVVLTMLGLMLSVLTCFQFHVYPVRQFAAYLVRRIRKRGANTEKEDTVIWGKTLTRWFDIFFALFSVAVIIFIAVVVKDLRTVLQFVGSFASAYIAFIVPPIWLLQVRRRSPSFAGARLRPSSVCWCSPWAASSLHSAPIQRWRLCKVGRCQACFFCGGRCRPVCWGFVAFLSCHFRSHSASTRAVAPED